MKIIHLISGGDVGGAKTHVHTLLQGLHQTETVLLICFTDGPFAREAKELGIPTRVLSNGLPRAIRTLTELIRTEGFEVIHCHGAKANMMGALLKQKLGIPTVTTVHSDYRLDYMGRPLAAMTYGLINKIALRRMDNWIGVSDMTVNMLVSRGFDVQRCFAIYNGVNFQGIEPSVDRQTYLSRLGVDAGPDTPVFGIAARINPVKDMETLIRAFALAVRDQPQCRLVIAGDGEQRKQMEALAAELCPAGTVTFAGWIEDTNSFYHALDVNVLTSLSETFPYALTEGARQGCATISSRVGGVPYLIDHEINGLLFRARDVEQLAKHMIRLAKDPALRRTFGQRLYDKTKSEFSIEATVARQKEIYATILRRRQRAQAKPRDGILICGAYGKGNSGDDAILNAMVTQLKADDPDMPIYVTTRTPRQTSRDVRVGSIHTFRFLAIRRRLCKTELYLSGGGSLVQDSTSSRSLWYYLHSIRTAKRTGNKVMMFSCGIGPVRRKLNRRLARRVVSRNVDAITLRDETSAQELRRLGILGIPTQVTADMAFLVDPAPAGQLATFLESVGVQSGTDYLLLAPRPWQEARRHIDDFAAAAQYGARAYGLVPILMAMEPTRDHAICRQIADKLEGLHCLIVDAPEDARLVVGLMRRVKAVIGMRLHSLVFAASQGTPFAGVAYDPKVSGFLDYIGQGEYCLLSQADEQTLKDLLDHMLLSQGEFGTAALRLRELARENCRVAWQLHEKGAIQ